MVQERDLDLNKVRLEDVTASHVQFCGSYSSSVPLSLLWSHHTIKKKKEKKRFRHFHLSKQSLRKTLRWGHEVVTVPSGDTKVRNEAAAKAEQTQSLPFFWFCFSSLSIVDESLRAPKTTRCTKNTRPAFTWHENTCRWGCSCGWRWAAVTPREARYGWVARPAVRDKPTCCGARGCSGVANIALRSSVLCRRFEVMCVAWRTRGRYQPNR